MTEMVDEVFESGFCLDRHSTVYQCMEEWDYVTRWWEGAYVQYPRSYDPIPNVNISDVEIILSYPTHRKHDITNVKQMKEISAPELKSELQAQASRPENLTA